MTFSRARGVILRAPYGVGLILLAFIVPAIANTPVLQGARSKARQLVEQTAPSAGARAQASPKALVRSDLRVITGTSDDIHPRWSNNGGLPAFVFASNRKGVERECPPPEEQTDTGTQGQSSAYKPLQASGGGSQYAYYHIWQGSDTGVGQQITIERGNQFFPALSPDGRFLAYCQSPEPPCPTAAPQQGGSAAQSSAFRLKQQGGGEQAPPKGLPLKLYIMDLNYPHTDPAPENVPVIMKVAAAPGFKLGANQLRPVWSPDGSMILFQSDSGPGGSWDLWVVDFVPPPQDVTPETAPTQVAYKIQYTSSREPDKGLSEPGLEDEIEPSWSWDGKWVAFTRASKAGLQEVPASQDPKLWIWTYGQKKTHIWVAPVRKPAAPVSMTVDASGAQSVLPPIYLGQPRQVTGFSVLVPGQTKPREADEREPDFTPGGGISFVSNRDDLNGDRVPDSVGGTWSVFTIYSIAEPEGAGGQTYDEGRNRARKETMAVPTPEKNNEEYPSWAPGATFPAEFGASLIYATDLPPGGAAPGGLPTRDIWLTRGDGGNTGSFALLSLPTVTPRLANPGGRVKITASVRSLDPTRVGIAYVYAVIRNPDDRLYGATTTGQPTDTDTGPPAQGLSLRAEIRRTLGNWVTSQVDSGETINVQIEVGAKAVDMIQLYDDGPTGGHGDDIANDGVYTNTWVTPDTESDFYLDIAVQGDRNITTGPFTGGLAFDYFDNVWGFSTKPFVARNKILFVSDYTAGQAWLRTRTGAPHHAVVQFPVEGYWLSRSHPEYVVEDVDGRPTAGPMVHTWPGVGGQLWDVLGENSPYGDAADVWRTQCRDPITYDVLAQYLPVQEEQVNERGATTKVQVAEKAVIWASPYTGDLTVGPGTLYDPETQKVIMRFLDNGGRMLLSGQNVAWALTEGGTKQNRLLEEYFGVTFVDDTDPDVAATWAGNRHVVQSATDTTGGTGTGTGTGVGTDQGETTQGGVGLGEDPIFGDTWKPHWRWEGQEDDPPSTMEITGPFGTYNPPHGSGDTKLDGAWNQLWLDAVTSATPTAQWPRLQYSYASATQQPRNAVYMKQDARTTARTLYFAFGLEGVHRRYRSFTIGNTTYHVCINRPAQIVHNALCWMRTGRITGQVFDAHLGTPIPNAVVRAVGDYRAPYRGQVMGAAKTDSQGRFTIKGLEADIYLLYAEKPGFIFQHPSRVAVHGGHETQVPESNLVMTRQPPGELKGRVLDAVTGGPIANARVVVQSTVEDVVITVTTSADGTYKVKPVPTGSYQVTADAEGYRAQTGSFQSTSNGTATLDFRLTPSGVTPGQDPTAPVVGKVVDQAGKPVAGAVVRAMLGSQQAASTVSGADGTYALMLKAGTYTLVAAVENRTGSAAVSVTPPDLSSVDITLGASTGPVMTIPAGVSLISLPAQYDGADAAAILGVSGLQMITWDGGRYVSYPARPANTFEPGRGYFVKLNAPAVVRDPGRAVSVDADGYFAISVKRGWNLIGCPFTAPVELSAVRVQSGTKRMTLSQAATAGLVKATVWGLSGGTYVRVTRLEPGKGYWFRAEQDVRLLIPSPVAGTGG
ncbi:MAG: carboxypeptidase regulatory-like domain-containing protein [Armatimonadota bacterium]